MKGRTNCGFSSGGNIKYIPACATLTILAPTDATVQISNGTISQILDDTYKTNVVDLYNIYNYYIKPSQFGEWTITATFDEINKIITVVVNETKEYKINTILPNTYQQLIYIGSGTNGSSGPYINLNFIPDDKLCFEYYYFCSYMSSYSDYQWTNFLGGGGFWAYKHEDQPRISYGFEDTEEENHYFGGENTALLLGDHYSKVDLLHGEFWIDNHYDTVTVVPFFERTDPFCILKCNDTNNSPGGGLPYMQLKNFKVSENGILIRYLIPCIKLADQVRGMYDIVNDVFYTNAGSGTFTIGDILVY